MFGTKAGQIVRLSGTFVKSNSLSPTKTKKKLGSAPADESIYVKVESSSLGRGKTRVVRERILGSKKVGRRERGILNAINDEKTSLARGGVAYGGNESVRRTRERCLEPKRLCGIKRGHANEAKIKRQNKGARRSRARTDNYSRARLTGHDLEYSKSSRGRGAH